MKQHAKYLGQSINQSINQDCNASWQTATRHSEWVRN